MLPLNSLLVGTPVWTVFSPSLVTLNKTKLVHVLFQMVRFLTFQCRLPLLKNQPMTNKIVKTQSWLTIISFAKPFLLNCAVSQITPKRNFQTNRSKPFFKPITSNTKTGNFYCLSALSNDYCTKSRGIWAFSRLVLVG